MRISITKRKNGFSLVEVLISVAILTLSTWSLFQSLNFGYILIHDIREIIVVSSTLERQMEIERNKILKNVANRTFDPNGYYAGDSILSNCGGSVIISQYGSVDMAEAKKVTISITWSPRLRPAKQVTRRISTIITKGGINYL